MQFKLFRPKSLEDLMRYQEIHYALIDSGAEKAYWYIGDCPIYTDGEYEGVEIDLETLVDLQEHERMVFNAKWN